jgi:hypothetical protein
MNLFEPDAFEQIPGQLSMDDVPERSNAPRGLTTREKRERKAERLRGWADSREAKQSALNEAARCDEEATGIPFGQPILVGHHSEKRHRRALERIDRAMGKAVDNSRKAEGMQSRAANIEAANDRAIYDDDPDAIERLTERIAALEAERDRRKVANSEYRREHKAELKAMSGYDRHHAVPFPPYSFSNLTGNIGRLRDRLARLQAPERGRVLVAKYAGECRKCGESVERGATAVYFKRSRELEHQDCGA